MNDMQIHCFSPTLAELGEGPLWNEGERALYWFDVIGRTLYRRLAANGAESSWSLNGMPGALALRCDGGLLMAFRNRIALAEGVGQPWVDLHQTLIDFSSERINDGAVDDRGRFWFGTFSPKFEPGGGALYCLDTNLTLRRMDSGFSMSNGIAWSPCGASMYFTDSHPGRIWRYRFDAINGTLGSRELFIDYTAREGRPDGCCVDTHGYLWVAEVDAGRIACYAQEGSPDRPPECTITLPLSKPTSVTFGGERLETLFITTEWRGLSADELRRQPLAGATFSVAGLARGLPQARFAA
ncbi:MAG: SMP-30/gluconolactonase/LRE family protein [Pigmentiphaga sp.]